LLVLGIGVQAASARAVLTTQHRQRDPHRHRQHERRCAAVIRSGGGGGDDTRHRDLARQQRLEPAARAVLR
jgi:hypothetical protein